MLFQKNWKWSRAYSSENSSEDQDIDDSYIQNEDTEEENSDNQSCSSSGPQNRNQYPELCYNSAEEIKIGLANYGN